jgi:hypothetical protein
MGTIVHRAVRKAEGGNGSGTLEVTSEWVDPQGTPLLREETRFVFRAGPSGQRAIDRTSTLTALDRAVTFTDNKEGMLGLRVTRALEHPATQPELFTDASGKATSVPVLNNDGVTGVYRTSEGKEGDAAWGTRGRWNMLTGTIDGGPVTVAILDHPSNVGYPTYWHARGYGLFAANSLGRKVFDKTQEELKLELAPGKSTTFRYRVLVLDAKPTPTQIEEEFKAFAR